MVKSSTNEYITKKQNKHHYTNELELKSLLIRINNRDKNTPNTNVELNARIKKYLKWYSALHKRKYKYPAKSNATKEHITQKIIKMSTKTQIDNDGYEDFGEIVLLMIKNILKMPNFSGYTFKDEFYSDAVYKILRYMHNFDHTMISKRTNTPVNAFAYISQIIHNSVIYVIMKHKKEQEKTRTYVTQEQTINAANTSEMGWGNAVEPCTGHGKVKITKIFRLTNLKPSELVSETLKITLDPLNASADVFEIHYPYSYEVTIDEYNKIRQLKNVKLKETPKDI